MGTHTGEDKIDGDHTDGRSVKNPEQEAEHPSPMQKDQQGQGAKKPHRDPEGQQGGTEGGGREQT